MVEEGLQEAVESDDAGEDSVYPEILTGHVEETGVEILNFEHPVDLKEGDFDDLLTR